MTDLSLERTNPHVITPLASALLAALDRLSQHPLCLEILAENMLYRGGIERFIQRLFLWAFQTVPSSVFSAAIELKVEPLVGNEALDLVCYQTTTEVAALRSNGELTSTEWFHHAVGLIEMKDNWNRKSIKSDVAKIRRIREHCVLSKRDEHEYYELLFIHTNSFDEEYNIAARIEYQLKKTLFILNKVFPNNEIVGRRDLLDAVRNPSDGTARTSFIAILVRLHFNE